MSTKIAYSIDEAAEALRVSRSTFYDLMTAGKVRTVKIGARRIIPASALEEFLGSAK